MVFFVVTFSHSTPARSLFALMKNLRFFWLIDKFMKLFFASCGIFLPFACACPDSLYESWDWIFFLLLLLLLRVVLFFHHLSVFRLDLFEINEWKRRMGEKKRFLALFAAIFTRVPSLSYENLIFLRLFILEIKTEIRKIFFLLLFILPLSQGRWSRKMEPNLCCCIRATVCSVGRKNQYCVNWFVLLISWERTFSMNVQASRDSPVKLH